MLFSHRMTQILPLFSPSPWRTGEPSPRRDGSLGRSFLLRISGLSFEGAKIRAWAEMTWSRYQARTYRRTSRYFPVKTPVCTFFLGVSVLTYAPTSELIYTVSSTAKHCAGHFCKTVTKLYQAAHRAKRLRHEATIAARSRRTLGSMAESTRPRLKCSLGVFWGGPVLEVKEDSNFSNSYMDCSPEWKKRQRDLMACICRYPRRAQCTQPAVLDQTTPSEFHSKASAQALQAMTQLNGQAN